MKQVQHNGYLLQEVDALATDFQKRHLYDNFYELDIDSVEWEDYQHVLFKHDLEIVGKANELTEEQAKGIVENIFERAYYDYCKSTDGQSWGGHYIYATALESLQSLIRSHDMKPETTLILKLF